MIMKIEMLPDGRKMFWICLLMTLLSLLFVVYMISMLCRDGREWRNHKDDMTETTLISHKYGFINREFIIQK